MTFDEIRLILQQVVISQRELQASQREFQTEIIELKSLARSNGRAIQSMLEQTTTDRLKREAEKAEHQARMERLEHISEALTNLLVSVDEDRPTILRKLNIIEQKSTDILERLPPDRSI
jgi:hypothetical protein